MDDVHYTSSTHPDWSKVENSSSFKTSFILMVAQTRYFSRRNKIPFDIWLTSFETF